MTAVVIKPKTVDPQAILGTVFESLAFAPSRVDRDKGVIKHVKILGPRSRNGSLPGTTYGLYPRTTMESAIRDRVYDGAKVNLNHPSRLNPLADRPWEERLGIARNIVLENDAEGEPGLYADVHYNRKYYDQQKLENVLEACENEGLSDSLGFSHNAETDKESDGKGGTIHTRIKRVRSIDLVADPATTRGLFESEDMAMSTGTTDTMEQAQTPPGGTAGASDATDPMEAVCQAFCNQLLAIYKGDGDAKTKTAAAKDLFQKDDKIRALLEPDGGDDPDDDDDEDMSEESINWAKAENFLLRGKIEAPTKAQIKSIMVLESEAERTELLECFNRPAPKVQAPAKERPKSGSALADPTLESERLKKENKQPMPSFLV